jgi:hypothetical protein
VDLAATKAYLPAATAGGLTAVAGGSAYSVFKNFETASNIGEQKQYCSEMLADMHNWADVDNVEELLLKLEMTQEKVESLLANVNVVNGSTRQGYKYAVINAGVQVTLSIISIWINATASRRDNDDVWDFVNVINMFVVPALIFSQYVIHSAFIASPLRKMDNRSIELSSELEKLRGSMPVQMWKLNKLTSEIGNYHRQLEGLNENIRHDKADLEVIVQEAKHIRSQITAINTDMDGEIEAQQTDLLKKENELKQRIMSNEETKKQSKEALQDLINNIDSLVAKLKTNFDQYQQFNDIYNHIREMKLQLDRGMNDNLSFSL